MICCETLQPCVFDKRSFSEHLDQLDAHRVVSEKLINFSFKTKMASSAGGPHGWTCISPKMQVTWFRPVEMQPPWNGGATNWKLHMKGKQEKPGERRNCEEFAGCNHMEHRPTTALSDCEQDMPASQPILLRSLGSFFLLICKMLLNIYIYCSPYKRWTCFLYNIFICSIRCLASVHITWQS